MTFECRECRSTGVVVAALERGGWKVTCSNGHEVFPMTGTTIVVPGKSPASKAR